MQESRERAAKKLGAIIDEIVRKASQKHLESFNEELDNNEQTV